jgi:hypothetical protein
VSTFELAVAFAFAVAAAVVTVAWYLIGKIIEIIEQWRQRR